MKEYIKPQTVINNIETDACVMVATSQTPFDPTKEQLGKHRDELWIEDVDLWGNESWTRVE